MKSEKTIVKLFLCSLFVFTSILQLKAQEITVRGKVTSSEDNSALPGTNIVIKGTTQGVISDMDGNYSIKANGADVLVFSFTGYISKEVTIGAQTTIDMALDPELQELGQVVVMGYSDKKKTEIASAVTVVSAEKMKGVSTVDIGNMIQGKVSGVQVINSNGEPGSRGSILIRGASTISGSTTPLYVVDGVVAGNSDPGIDPNSIENITILKDAGATGMYGSRANAGVVIITTKQGTSEKPVFEVNATVGQKYADFGKIEMMNSQEYYEAHKLMYLKPNGSPDMGVFERNYPKSLLNTDFDWVDEAFSPALYQSYNVSASGKSNKYKYYLGATYTSDEGTFMNTKYREFSLRSNNGYAFSDKVNFTTNIDVKFSNLYATASTDDLMYIFLASPFDNAYDSEGNLKYVDRTTPWQFREAFNPLHNIKNKENTSMNGSAGLQSSLNIKLFPFLTFSNSFSGNMNGGKNTNIIFPGISGDLHGSGSYHRGYTDGYGSTITSLLKFNQTFGKHSISGLIGGELSYGYSDFSDVTTDNVPYGSKVIEGTRYKGTPSGFYEETAMNSFISQFNYGFADKYFLTGSYRIDANSKFAPNNKSAAFPTVSASWLISKEGFLENSTIIDMLKLRASFGYTGSDNIGPSRYFALYALNTTALGATGIFPSQAQNYDLTWEKTRQMNIGVEANLFKRIDLTLDVYNNLTTDLLFPVSQNTTTGYEKRWENAGEVTNKGIEFSISSTNIKTSNFTWETEFNISLNDNEVTGGKQYIRKQEELQVMVKKGYALYTYVLPVWAGVDPETGDPLWERVTTDANGDVVPLRDANGKILTTNDYDISLSQPVGNPYPTYQGGFNTTLTYKNISLRASLAYLGGNKVYNGNMSKFDTDGNEPRNNWMKLDDMTRWRKRGDIADLPKMNANPSSYKASTRYLEDGDYLKIRNITLSYSLPKRWFGNAINSMSLSLSADNVYSWFKAHTFDPEASLNSPWFLPGQLYFDYPKSRQYNVILNVKF